MGRALANGAVPGRPLVGLALLVGATLELQTLQLLDPPGDVGAEHRRIGVDGVIDVEGGGRCRPMVRGNLQQVVDIRIARPVVETRAERPAPGRRP